MLKFGTPTIALPLAIKKCTVQTGCTVIVWIGVKIGVNFRVVARMVVLLFLLQ